MIPRLAGTLLHFLWQGTLIAGLYSMVRRRPPCARSAALRYGFACAALAFMAIVPVLTYVATAPGEVSLNGLTITASPVSFAGGIHKDWFAPVALVGSRSWPDGATKWIVILWFSGALAFLSRFLGGWLLATRLRSALVRPGPTEWQAGLDLLRMRLRVSRPVRLLVSGAVQVPTVVGCLRPLVLVPVGALTGLAPEFVEALLAHELAHIRRHDYLIGILQCFVEAMLFYQPAVWWVSNRIREERENCCDDIAAALCGDPVVYAGALAELESLRPAHLHPALAASGASLTKRISRLLGGSRSPVQAPHGLGPIAVACVVAGLIVAQRSGAQSAVVATSALPSFEVSSIRSSDPDSQLKIQFAPGGGLVVSHATLRFLIKIAYDVSDDQLVGGPAWLGSRRFDVQAKPDKAVPGDPEKMTKDELLLFHEPIRLRLQRLLAERFGLELRKESKPMPIFALVTAKNGPKLRRDASSGDPVMEQRAGRGALLATRVDMDTLARFLSEGQTGRPVVNMTGLKGNFDFRLDWTPDPSLNPQVDPNQQQPTDPGGVSLFTALQQQIGLKLDPRVGSADTLVVTRAELPSAN